MAVTGVHQHILLLLLTSVFSYCVPPFPLPLAPAPLPNPEHTNKQVRRQMSERQAAHDDRNLARALTPAERRDKKLKKLFEGSGMGSSSGAVVGGGGSSSSLAAVYRVASLAHGQHRFKVDVNAKENHMSGAWCCCWVRYKWCWVVVRVFCCVLVARRFWASSFGSMLN